MCFLKICVFGNQLGTALGFLIPPYIVVKSDSIEFMQMRFYWLLIPVAVLCGIALLLAILRNENNFKNEFKNKMRLKFAQMCLL